MNVDDGVTTIDSAVSYGNANNPNIIAVAYSNVDLDPGTGTTLYGIDSIANTLVQFTNPNAGAATTIGSLGANPGAVSGFDIQQDTNVGYVSLQRPGDTYSQLYTVSLATGELGPSLGILGNDEDGILIRGIAVAPPVVVPEPSSIALAAMAMLGLLIYRRKQTA